MFERSVFSFTKPTGVYVDFPGIDCLRSAESPFLSGELLLARCQDYFEDISLSSPPLITLTVLTFLLVRLILTLTHTHGTIDIAFGLMHTYLLSYNGVYCCGIWYYGLFVCFV